MKTYHDYHFFDYETDELLIIGTSAETELQQNCELLKRLYWNYNKRKVNLILAVQTYTGERYIF